MKVAVYPGSFDPITIGHLDVIERGANIFDELIIVVLVNVDKKGLFDISERVELIKKATCHLNNVKIESFNGLLVDFMDKNKASVILKGLRTNTDFEYELQMALVNKKLAPKIETLFLMSSSEYSHISSSVVKQVGKFGGSILGLVPDVIIQDVIEKLKGE